MNNIKEFIKNNKILIIVFIIVLIILTYNIIISNKEKNTLDYRQNYVEEEYELKQYKENEYNVVEMSIEDLINLYYKKFNNYQINNKEKAWEMLSDNTKKRYNNNIEEYNNYLKENITINTKNNKVEKYKEMSYGYDIIDSENNNYIIYENGIWNIKIEIK